MTAGTELTAGGAIFARLQKLGVDVVFANSGTDFPPIIEGLAEADALEIPLPHAVLVSHELVAVGMAHGYWLGTGRAQAVMLHTNVGLANGIVGAINAAADHVPMILMSGRTPTTEAGRFGSRTTPIGWGQEMRDQHALIRESVKWDYEVRFPEQLPDVLDRAHAIASSTPNGPVYVSLPRETLCEPCPADAVEAPLSAAPTTVVADSGAIEELADRIARAERPLVITQGGAGGPDGFAALGHIAETWALPVCQYWALTNAIDSSHPMQIGNDPGPWLVDADLVIAIDCLAPWMPDKHTIPDDCEVVHLGPDPLSMRYPVRGFRVSAATSSEVEPALVALRRALEKRTPASVVAERRTTITEAAAERRAGLAETARLEPGQAMTRTFAAGRIGAAVRNHRSTVLCELGAPMEHVAPEGFDNWRLGPHAGGLGWGIPCAMGLAMADPERLVVTTVGDGSYLFSNPPACHQTAAGQGIAFLTVVLNNQRYEAVRRSVLGMYPTGYAAKADEVPLTELPSPDLVKLGEACGVHSVRVDDAEELDAALAEGIRVVLEEGRQALVEVMITD